MTVPIKSRALDIADFRLRKALLDPLQNSDRRGRRTIVIPLQGIKTVCVRADDRNS